MHIKYISLSVYAIIPLGYVADANNMKVPLMTEIIGVFAAIMTTSSFLPQAIKIFRTGETEGISLVMYILFVFGVSGWLTYGVLIGSLPIICSNSITLVSASTILFLKVRSICVNSKGAASADSALAA